MPLPKTITVTTGADGEPAMKSTVSSVAKRGLHERRRHHQHPAREPVGERTADRTEQGDGDEGGGRDGAGPRGLARRLGHVDADRDRLHPRADVRHERAGPQSRVLRVPERGDRQEGHDDSGR